tara:strand:+ start:5186 stop:6373 length:1188 start_codon:yes stop_codon:yes gene_type:complete
MKKILIYTENYLFGGGNRYLIDTVNALNKEYKVFIFSNKNGLFSSDFENIKRHYVYKGLNIRTTSYYVNYARNKSFLIKIIIHGLIKFLNIFLISYFKNRNIRIFKHELNLIRPDLIFSFNGGFPAAFSCLDLVILSKLLKIPVYLSVVSVPGNKSIIERIFYSELLNDFSDFIVNCDSIKNNLIDTRSFSKNKIFVLNNSINESYFKYPKKDTNNKLLKIGYVSRIESSKGIYDLIYSFIELIKTNNQVELVVVGKGDSSKLKSICNKHNINNNVSILGFYAGDIMDLINDFDILVFPSYWEGLPYTILEAMTLSKIIISTNVGGIPDVIKNNFSGKLISPNNISGLTDVLIDVVNNFDVYNYMGENALEHIKNHHTFDVFTKKLSNLIKIKLN